MRSISTAKMQVIFCGLNIWAKTTLSHQPLVRMG